LKPLKQPELNRIVHHGCSMPNYNHKEHDTMFLHTRCHPEYPLCASYTASTGVLSLSCAACEK
jgi:hypothetical protein